MVLSRVNGSDYRRGWIDNWIYWVTLQLQLQCTHYSRLSRKATLYSLQWQRLLSLCCTALSRLSLSKAQDLLQTKFFFSHWPSTNFPLLFGRLLSLSSGLTASLTHNCQLTGRSVKLLLALARTVILGFGPLSGPMTIFFQDFYVF
jgi:hypothetical protein